MSAASGPLVATYDLVMLDLDGVVYVGEHAVPGAAEHLGALRSCGSRLAFVTNNAARPPGVVAEHLRRLGIAADVGDVVTSAQAAAHLLAERFGAGARVVCLGGPGLEQALTEFGLVPVGAEDEAVAAVSGYGPDVLWRDIMRVAVRVRDGLPWWATNADSTIPTTFGVAPGHGVLVETLVRFARATPTVAGKPRRPLLDEAVRRLGGGRPLMVGDRLDTDIEGAHEAEVDSLLVMTGVTGLAELVAASPRQRPTYVASGLSGLLEPHPAPVRDHDGWRLDGWCGRVQDGRLDVSGDGSVDDWWRLVAAAAWEHLDEVGEPVAVEGLGVPGEGPPAR